jgi:hypothetical protein
MLTSDLRASNVDATVSRMFDPIPIHIAVDRMRARMEGPAPERSPARSRTLVASLLHRLADRIEGPSIARPRPAAHPLSARAARGPRPGQ